MKSLSIHHALASRGPGLTSDIAADLRAAGISAAAARQRVSRLSGDVQILRGLRFPKRARFIYLQGQFGSTRYWDALVRAIDQANPAYAAALNAMRCRGGLIPAEHFDIVSGSPLRQARQLPSSAVLSALISVDLIRRSSLEGVGELLVLAGAEMPDLFEWQQRLRPRLVTENVLLNAIRDWAGRMNFASPKVTTIRDDPTPPQFATFRFDLTGPSYLKPMQRVRKLKVTPGFMVADVVAGQELNEQHVMPFIRKVTMLSHMRKLRPFLPMLVADSFTPAALRACRSRGIVATRPETLFGEDVARGLADLLETLSNAAAIAAAAPDKIVRVFNSLSRIEGAAGNLRGALFELIVGHLVRSIDGGSIDIGAVVHHPTNHKSAEIDVRRVKEREVTFYECRGHQPGTRVRADAIEKWLEEKVPTIYDAHRRIGRFESSNYRFEYWSCGTFDEDAIALLKEASENTHRYAISWKNSDAIEEYARSLQTGGIMKILNEHYLEHPLAQISVAGGASVVHAATG